MSSVVSACLNRPNSVYRSEYGTRLSYSIGSANSYSDPGSKRTTFLPSSNSAWSPTYDSSVRASWASVADTISRTRATYHKRISTRMQSIRATTASLPCPRSSTMTSLSLSRSTLRERDRRENVTIATKKAGIHTRWSPVLMRCDRAVSRTVTRSSTSSTSATKRVRARYVGVPGVMR